MKKLSCLLLTAAVLTMSGCSDKYFDVNTNPNTPTSVSPELILSNALAVTGARLGHNQIGSFFGGYWAPSGSYSGFFEERQYDYNNTYGTGVWNSCYDNLEDYQQIEDAGTKQNWKAVTGIAKVMKAYNFQILVDAYNNVPYSDALKGTASIRPKYDDAQAIYDDLAKKLDEAVADLKTPIATTNPSPGAFDIVFKGDLTKWVRFANTLKLRILLRQTNIAAKEATLKTEIAKIAANGGFLLAGENVLVNPGYSKSTNKQNPFWENYAYQASGLDAGTRQAYVYSDFFITSLTTLKDDDRLPQLALKNNAGIYRGVPLGEGNDANLFPKASWFGPGILKSFDQSSVLMTAAEGFFLQAEAVQRGYLTGDAKTLYNGGILESYKYLGVPNAATAAAAYAARTTPLVGFDASPDKIEAIITQKWIAMASLTGFEAWSEFRRTGFPRIPLATKAIQPKYPQRLFYPSSEVSNNPDNVLAQGQLNQFDNKIFWAKK